MPLTQRATWTLVVLSAGFAVLLGACWVLLSPGFVDLPASLWSDNALTGLGMVAVVLALEGVVNAALRFRWRTRRPAEMPLRQAAILLFGSTVSVLIAWSVAFHRFPAPYGAALAVFDFAVALFVSLLMLVGGRYVLRLDRPGELGGAPDPSEALRRSWSRLGLRGYLLLTLLLFGAGSTLLLASFGHVRVYRESVEQRTEVSQTLLALTARRLESIPRERLLTKLWRTRVPQGIALRLLDRQGRAVQGEDVDRDRGGPAAAVASRVFLRGGGHCVTTVRFVQGCRWIRLGAPSEDLVLAAYTWPQSTTRSSPVALAVALFALVLLLFAGLIATFMGADTARELNEVATRIRALAERAEDGLGEPLQPTSSDETGLLVQQFGELRQRLSADLAHSRRDLHRSVAVNRAKTEFLEEVNYALRTPLTVVVGFTELLLEGARGELNPEQKQDAQITLDSSRQLLGLVSDILDLSFCEAGGLRLRLEVVDLAALIRSEVASTRAALPSGAVILRHELPESLPQVVLDPVRVRRVLSNLLSNAVKFTESGEIVVRVTRPAADHVEVSVRDTGTGIASEHHSLVFEQYRQAPQRRPKQLRGSGLGLAIVRQLVLLHEGRVWLESTPGEGSEFFFSLPVGGPLDRERAVGSASSEAGPGVEPAVRGRP
ncbi:MAG: HAMP domain-containing sensor histidine kinase [bacterium]